MQTDGVDSALGAPAGSAPVEPADVVEAVAPAAPDEPAMSAELSAALEPSIVAAEPAAEPESARAPSPALSDITPTTQHPLGPWPDVEAFKLAWRDWANSSSPSFRLVVRSAVAFGSGSQGRNVGFCELVCSKPHRAEGKVRRAARVAAQRSDLSVSDPGRPEDRRWTEWALVRRTFCTI